MREYKAINSMSRMRRVILISLLYLFIIGFIGTASANTNATITLNGGAPTANADGTFTYTYTVKNTGTENIYEIYVQGEGLISETHPYLWGGSIGGIYDGKKAAHWGTATVSGSIKAGKSKTFSYTSKYGPGDVAWKVESGVGTDPGFAKGATIGAIPEFTTIAMPVATILGLTFLFSRRKLKE